MPWIYLLNRNGRTVPHNFAILMAPPTVDDGSEVYTHVWASVWTRNNTTVKLRINEDVSACTSSICVKCDSLENP